MPQVVTVDKVKGKNSVPAFDAGLKENDLILAVNGQMLKPADSLEEVLQNYHSGDTLKISVLRNKQKIDLSIKIGELK